MVKQVLDLPTATLPLSGNESLLLVQGSKDVKTPIAMAAPLQVFGDLPTTGVAIGALAYIPDAVGGGNVGWFDGTAWRNPPGGNVVSTLGPGMFVVGIGPSTDEAHNRGWDRGTYYVSIDGLTWFKAVISSLSNGILGGAYANGDFIFTGLFGARGAIQGNQHPDNPTTWNGTLFGTGQAPTAITAYDNNTGLFTVAVSGLGNVSFQNPMPAAIIPPSPPADGWPTVGVDNSGGVMAGVGTAGPMELKVATTVIGGVNTDYLLVKHSGAADYLPVETAALAARPFVDPTDVLREILLTGLVLKGLMWGIVKTTAVTFQPGDQ